MPEWREEIRQRLAPLRLAPTREAEIVEEWSQHLDDRYGAMRSRGLPGAEAYQSALADLPDAEAMARALRSVEESRPPEPRLFGNLRRDVRDALRAMARRPGFTAVAMLTLALGIGASTAIFSVVDAVLLRPLPYPQPERIVTFFGTAPEKGLPEVNMPDGLVTFFHDQTRVFEKLAAYNTGGFNLNEGGVPERVAGAVVSIDFFAVFGIRPLLGRVFLPKEDTRGNNRVAVLSHALWQRRFGGDPNIVGKAIHLADIPMQVVGVMPAGFEFPARSTLWTPLVLDPTAFNCWCYSTIGRLKEGRSAIDARRDLESLADDFGMRRRDVFPDAKPGGARFVAMPLLDYLVGDVRTPLFVLLGAVGLVMLIACANIANLLLARAATRMRELALRACLGASATRIAGMMLTESLMLALGGAAIGLLLASLLIQIVRGMPIDLLPRLDQVHLNPAVLAFTVCLALLNGVLFGALPARMGARADLQDALKDGARGSTSGPSRRISNAFVISQFALSLVLLVGAGLLLRSFGRLTSVNPGFEASNTVVARLQLPYPKYANDTVVRVFYGRLLDETSRLPGVRAVGLATRIPFSPGNPQDNIFAEGREPRPGEAVIVANMRNVTPGYFQAIGTPILKGRPFLATDDASAPMVAIVDETFARRYWPNEEAIGKRFRTDADPARTPWVTIVGIAPNVKHRGLDEIPSLQVYLSFAQRPEWGMYLVVRTTTEPSTLVTAIRERVMTLDPTLPLYDVQTMDRALEASLAPKRLTNLMLSTFAIAALLLAAVGIYGVMSLNVNGRTHEFGVRLALGGQPRDLLRLVLRQGMLLALIGVGLGLAGAAWLSRFVRSMLYGVGTFDPLTFATVALTLTLVAAVACFLPARRATRADPLTSLRSE